jgi:hypothetical protein
MVHTDLVHFVAKTWFWWWMLANAVVLRWFHILSKRSQLEIPDPLAAVEVEDETEYIVSWQLLRNAQPVSLSKLKDAF